MADDYLNTLVENHFRKCPFCGSGPKFKISGIFTKSIQCKNCSGKWKVENRGYNKEPWLKYTRPSTDRKYTLLLHVSRPFLFWETVEEVNNVDLKKITKTLPYGVMDTLVLDKKESVLARWQGFDLENEGMLLLTGNKLIWLRDEKDGRFYVDYTIPLENITQIMPSPWEKNPGELERIEMTDGYGGVYGVTIERMEKYPLAKPVIDAAIRTKKQEIEKTQKMQRVHLVFDFSFLQDYMKKGGMVLQEFRCPRCGAPVMIPKHGSETKCDHCGSSILA